MTLRPAMAGSAERHFYLGNSLTNLVGDLREKPPDRVSLSRQNMFAEFRGFRSGDFIAR